MSAGQKYGSTIAQFQDLSHSLEFERAWIQEVLRKPITTTMNPKMVKSHTVIKVRMWQLIACQLQICHWSCLHCHPPVNFWYSLKGAENQSQNQDIKACMSNLNGQHYNCHPAHTLPRLQHIDDSFSSRQYIDCMEMCIATYSLYTKLHFLSLIIGSTCFFDMNLLIDIFKSTPKPLTKRKKSCHRDQKSHLW